MQQNELFVVQERIGNAWRRELERSSQVYEKVIAKLRAENDIQKTELAHWHAQIKIAQKARILRIKAKEANQEDVSKAVATFGAEKELNNFFI